MRAPAPATAGAQQVVANAIALLLAYVIPRAFTVAAVVVAARLLGTADFGVYGSAAALAVLLSVAASLGMHPLLVREMARAPGKAPSLIAAADRVKAASGVVMLAALAIAARALFPGDARAQAAAMVLGLGWVFQSFAENLSAYFQAVERMRRWTEAAALFGVVSAAVGISLLVATGSVVGFCAGFTAGWGTALAWLRLRLPPEARGGRGASAATVVALVRGTLPFAAAFVALTVYCKVDVLLLRHWRGDHDVGLYTAAYKFVDVFQALVIIAAGAVYPRLSRSRPREDRTPWAGTRSTEIILLGAAPAGLTLHLVARPLVLLLFGPEYAEAGAAVAWIGLLLPLLALSLHSGYVLGAAGRIRSMAVLYAAGVGINVALNAWLVPGRGAEGAALARLGSEALLAAGFLVTVGWLARAAPRARAVALAGGVAAGAALLGALPDVTGGWIRGGVLMAATALLYALAGAAQPGEAASFMAALRRGAPAHGGEAT